MLIGLVAAAVGGAFWIAFAVGVTVAAITGTAYAELVTKYPQAAGAALYVNKAFGNKALTFLITVSFLSSSFAAAGALADGFSAYFATLWAGPPALLVTLVFIVVLSIVNFIGITESVVINMLMAFVEIAGLMIVLIIGIWYIAEGNADFATLTEFQTESGTSPALAILAGVALSFFAMTGFENTANVAEETIDPYRSFPRSLIGGMITAGVIYVLVSMAAALTVSTDDLAASPAALLEVIEKGILPINDRVHDHPVLGDRVDRDHQHHPGRRGDPAADPLRHGQGGRRARRLRQDPPQPPQPVGRPAVQRRRGVCAARGRARWRPTSRGRA